MWKQAMCLISLFIYCFTVNNYNVNSRIFQQIKSIFHRHFIVPVLCQKIVSIKVFSETIAIRLTKIKVFSQIYTDIMKMYQKFQTIWNNIGIKKSIKWVGIIYQAIFTLYIIYIYIKL